MRVSRLLFPVWLFLAGVPVDVSWAHVEGPPGFPCDQGPFGVPGLQSPPDEIGQWGPVQGWPAVATHATLLPSGKVLFWFKGCCIPGGSTY